MTKTYKAALIRRMGRVSGLYLVTTWRADKNLGPCMVDHREVIAGNEQEAIAAVAQ